MMFINYLMADYINVITSLYYFCSINAFSDTKAKFGMTIFTKDDSFQMGFDSEQDRDMWLADMRLLSHSSHQSCSVVRKLYNSRQLIRL